MSTWLSTFFFVQMIIEHGGGDMYAVTLTITKVEQFMKYLSMIFFHLLVIIYIASIILIICLNLQLIIY